MDWPRRIACLTEETTETLFLLGEQARIVGVSSYTLRPPEARKLPRVSAYVTARFDRLEALDPDLVLAFSDLQADIVAELVRRGRTVAAFNQRSVAEILDSILALGRLVGAGAKAEALVARLRGGLDGIRESAARLPRRPRVFFEEWPDPLISGIRWVEELVEIAGGEPVFPELRGGKSAKERIVDPAEVARRDPELVLASWCGKKVRPERILARPGWERVTAVLRGQVHELKSSIILQPGPASLTDGVRRLHELIAGAAREARGTSPRPGR